MIFFGDLALGVIVEHHPSEGESALHATTFDTIAKQAATDPSAQSVANLLGIRSPMDLKLARGTASSTADAAPHGPLMLDVPARPTLPLVGRDDLVEAAGRLLDRGSDVVLLGGLPGVGKSALAGELARIR